MPLAGSKAAAAGKANCSLTVCLLQEARQQLLVMVGVLRELDVEHKGGHTAAADMAYLYAMTHVWFTVERNYKVCSLLSLMFILLISQPFYNWIMMLVYSIAVVGCSCNTAGMLRYVDKSQNCQ